MGELLASSPTRRILSMAGGILVFLGLLFPAYFSLLFSGSATVYLTNSLLESSTLLLQETLAALSALVVFGVALGRLSPAWYGGITAFLLLCCMCSCAAARLGIALALPLVIIGVPAVIIIAISHHLSGRARAWLALSFSLLGLATLWFTPTLSWQPLEDFTTGPGATIFDLVGVAGVLCFLGFLLALASSILALRSQAKDAALAL
jgi:hypothetical protein